MKWKDRSKLPILERIHRNFVDMFYNLTQIKGFMWLELFVNILCVLEVNFKLYRNVEFRDEINVASMNWKDNIPKQSLYCDGCIYKTYSKIARFFYGSQMDGFCYYLNRGDFTYGNYTQILWDGCKECGVYEEENDSDE